MNVEYLYVDQSRMAMVNVGTGKLFFYNNNFLGTPVLMTDDTGTVVWEADYKPFGEAGVNGKSTVVNNFRFAGQYYDEKTGLHYNWHRYYDPKTGRYLTPDPLGIDGGINLYAYTANNPINGYDLDGAKPVFQGKNCPSDEFDPDYIIYELYGIDVDELRKQAILQQLYLMSALFPPSGFNVKVPKSWMNKTIGKPYPTKINRAGKLQPYDPKTGRFLKNDANPGFKLSPLNRFVTGFGHGWAEAKGASGATPVGRAGNIGYMIGNFIGNIF
jgi:RHS repeat-associated protein